jgi:ABC-type uncharacterized transport system permease subunit
VRRARDRGTSDAQRQDSFVALVIAFQDTAYGYAIAPTEALAGLGIQLLWVGALVVAAALLAISRWLWRRGVRRYVGTST